MSVHTILVAHDGSEGAGHALMWAVELAEQAGARVVVVHAWSPLEELGKHEPPFDFARLHHEALRVLTEEWCRAAQGTGVDLETRLIEDLPVPGIVQAARDVGADLIVCGTRGRGRVKQLVLGSVARELPTKSHLPVTIVPPP